MKVLGISPLDKDATVSVVDGGEILFAAGEERFSRVKQQDGFPRLALQSALEYAGWVPDDIEAIVYPFLTAEDEWKLIQRNLQEEFAFLDEFVVESVRQTVAAAKKKVPRRSGVIHGLSSPNEKFDKGPVYNLAYRLLGMNRHLARRMARRGSRQWAELARESFLKWDAELQKGMREFGIDGRLKRMEHHLSHAANSYFASGFEKALCVTLDGYGTGLAGSVSLAEDGKIRRLDGVKFPNSLGTMYEHVTSSLGFKPSRHEGKIVGLASYGDPQILSEVLLSRIEQLPGGFRIFESNNIFLSRLLAAEFPKIDVAAAYQHVLEVVATRYIRHWVEKTGVDTVVLSGGVAANVKLNQRVFEIPAVRKIFVYPNMGDGGCGTGGALQHSLKGRRRETIKDVYLGPGFGEQELQSSLEAANLTFEKPDNLAERLAREIHAGKVVARFDGRMEYGPRALGNRSILYHAREPEVNQWLNKRLGRTEFMPFAPVTLYEAREKYYENISGAEHTAEFMTITFDCTELMKKECPAAVHIDGTARPQLIRREVNPGYYDIVQEYEKLSGISSLINTSFNMHEEPIVCTPDDAVRAFLDGSLDLLALGPFLVEHPVMQRR